MSLTALGLARTYLGVSESSAAGRAHIGAWLAEAGLVGADPRETAWCGCFMAHVCRRLALPVPSTPFRARAWLTLERRVELGELVAGFDVVVLSRGRGPQPGPEVLQATGHVGLFDGWAADGRLLLLSGNQGDAVTVARFAPDRFLGGRRLL